MMARVLGDTQLKELAETLTQILTTYKKIEKSAIPDVVKTGSIYKYDKLMLLKLLERIADVLDGSEE